jgi:hypothetical protein
MKHKTSLLTLAATTVLAGSAYSQTVIDITGSTAGRSAVHTQILALLSGETLAWNGGSSASGATRVIYNGTYGGNSVTIRTFWSGSAAGVRDVSNQVQLAASYFDKTTDTSAGTTAAGVNIPSPTLAPASAETVSEIGFSDVFQSSTAFTTNTLVDETKVGVIPFKFFRNNGSSSLLTNMTPGLHNNLYKALGEAPLSMFTGNAAQSGITVYATGRDEFSGTRITCLAETGAGVFSTLNQYTGTVTSGAATLNFVGNGGYASGSGVSGLLSATYSGGIIVGYLGASDWATAVSGGAQELAYNGVTLGANSDLIRNGQYSFWGYLHQSRMTLTSTSLTFYNALAAALKLAPGSGLVLEGTMNVERAADGAAITPK